MSRLGIAAASLLLAVACGGKGKDAKTTPDPKAGSGDASQSMKDTGDPVDPGGRPGGAGTGSGSAGPGSPGGTGANAGSGAVAGGGGVP
ncbi:MAG TPA: hypothetical protein VN253_18530, partial [Kofleriaceae bacterium]|nr:hypothetical protein [Kofleriaceae bacterium]